MMQNWFNTLWYVRLKRPYILAKNYDQGSGPGIVLLHGIGRTGNVWKRVTELLQVGAPGSRVVAFDLLGFGNSPKPDHLQYDIDDHAAAVIASIKKARIQKPVVLVGHSMGSLVAVRVARLQPDLVRHLVLYEMPLYEGLPKKWHYKTRINTYFKLYNWIARQNPTFDEVENQVKQRLTQRIVGADLNKESWQPYIKSLKNTIMDQTADEDLPLLSMPADIIYGSRDLFVIRGKVQQSLGLDSKLVTLHTIKERHVISEQASSFIVERILLTER